MDVNKITEQIIGGAIEVHRTLGPGLLESAYEECVCREMTLRGLQFERQRPLPVEYKGVTLCGEKGIADGTVVQSRNAEKRSS